MDAVTGWASKMFMKQKMGNIGESFSAGNSNDASAQARKDLAARRAEREAEQQSKASTSKAKNKGSSMAEKWAANKARNNN